MASVGHLRLHKPQKMHASISMIILPRAIFAYTLCFSGCISVAGRVNKLLVTVFAIVKSFTVHLSVQLMHGSIVRIMLGISATCEPFMVVTIAGMFAKVGVRTLNRSRLREPFALK